MLLRFTTCWFDSPSHCKMITTIKLANTQSHHPITISFLFCGERTFKIYSLSNFQEYTIALLTAVTMPCTRSPESTHNLKLYSLTNISPFPPPPSPLFLRTWLSYISHITEIIWQLSFCVWLVLSAAALGAFGRPVEHSPWAALTVCPDVLLPPDGEQLERRFVHLSTTA